jgi:Fic family protein
MDIRLHGDWESWIQFFLKAVQESAEMGVESATHIHMLMIRDRKRIQTADVSATTLLAWDQLCREPILTNALLVKRLSSSKPTVQRAIDHLLTLGIITEISGKQRHRRYAYQAYLEILTRDTTTRIG